MSDHKDDTITKENAPPKVVPQITTVTNISAKFSYLKKGEYDIWAIKMQNFISSSDLLCWNIILKGNNAKSMTTDNDGNLKSHPPVTTEEYLQVQREEKARTILLSTLPDEHMGDFYHMIDARDISNAIKARFEEGLDKGYDKIKKILTQMNTLKIKPKPKDVNMKFLRGLPPSWTGIALILKTKGGLEYISFDDMYNKLKFLEINTKGYSLSSSTFSNAGFGYSKSKCSVVDDVIYYFFANHKIDQHLVYEDLDQMNKDKEYDLKHHMAMLFIKKYKSKEAGKDRSDSKAMVVVNGSIDWDKQTEEGNTEPRSLENFGMVAGIKIESDADSEGEVVFADDAIPTSVFVSSGDVAAAVVSPQSKIEFALMGLSTEAKWNNSGEPIYNRFASVDHMKAVPPPLTRNYMPPSNIPDIDESQMVYGKKATDSSEIKTNENIISYSNDYVFFDFSDSISIPASESRDTIVIDCDSQEDFPSVCTSSIETDVKSSKTLCNKLGSFNKESYFRKHKSVASKSCYVCGSYLHLIKDCDLHEQRLAKRNAEGKGILERRPTRKPVNPNRPKPVSASQQNPVSTGLQNLVSAGQQNPVSAGQPNPVSADEAIFACYSIPLSVSAGDGILGPRPLNIQPKSTNFHSFTHNNQQIIFPITHNSLYSLYMTGGLNGKTAVKPSTGWKRQKDRGIVDSGCSRSMSGNKDKLEDFEDFDGGEVTFGCSIGKISGKGTIKTKTLNFENVLYVKELQHFNLIAVSQICDQTHRARLVAQGHRQEEGIDYTDVFAPVARIKAIRLFLAFASFMGFMVYQIDVKSAFLYGKIAEEAPRAWYKRLSTFLLKHGYRRGTIDKTLFIKKDSKDIMLVQLYVDDIIFGSIRKDWCEEFETLMQSEFEMSSMGPLTFFLGLQVYQRPDGIFIHQEKYVAGILRKFDLDNSKLGSTLFEPQKIREKNVPDELISVHLYRSMIGCLMYLTATRPDIMFPVCAAARHQVTPKTANLLSVKRIFKYLTAYPKLGLWYPRDSPFDLEAFSDSDYAGVNGDRK
nr:hypothetical protein [Tanacetum cinerariifolium]